MSCRLGAEQLSAFIDGDLEAEEAEDVAAHLQGCTECWQLCEEIRELVAASAALPRFAPHKPAAEDAMWRRIQARLEPEPRSFWQRLGLRRRWHWGMAGGLAGAVALALVFLGQSGDLGGASLPAPAPSDEALWRDAEVEFEAAETHYLRAIADLRRLATRERPAWPEARRRDFDAALAQLERATTACREVARSRRRDPDAQAVLYRAYQEQISFLEESLLRAAAEGR